MTLVEITTAIAADNLSAEGKGVLFTAQDVQELFEAIDTVTYEDLLLEYRTESILMKLIYEATKAYGRQKWQEGVEAARNGIVKDESCAPEFVD